MATANLGLPFGETSDFVLANKTGVFNFYPSIETARLDADRANGLLCRNCGRRFTEKDQHQILHRPARVCSACEKPTWPEPDDQTYEPMTWADFQIGQRNHYLSDPPEPITAEKWIQMLEVLPPMQWEQSGNFNSFLMSEMYSGSYTHQYVRRGYGDNATYWSKMVDARDRSTWMTYESLAMARCNQGVATI